MFLSLAFLEIYDLACFDVFVFEEISFGLDEMFVSRKNNVVYNYGITVNSHKTLTIYWKRLVLFFF